MIEELGSRRTSTFLALLETPDLSLAPQDRAALGMFIDRLAEQFGQWRPRLLMSVLNPDCRGQLRM